MPRLNTSSRLVTPECPYTSAMALRARLSRTRGRRFRESQPGVGAGIACDGVPRNRRTKWLPRTASRESIGCFSLAEPDFGSNPAGMRTNAKCDGGDSVGQQHQDVDHQWQDL